MEFQNNNIISESDDRSYSLTKYRAIVDSGATLTQVPQPYYDWLLKELSLSVDFVDTKKTNGLGATYYCTEGKSIPIPYFRLGG